jgi:hypothetical protein
MIMMKKKREEAAAMNMNLAKKTPFFIPFPMV